MAAGFGPAKPRCETFILLTLNSFVERQVPNWPGLKKIKMKLV